MRFDTLKKKIGADHLTFEGGLGDLIYVRFFSQTSGDRFFSLTYKAMGQIISKAEHLTLFLYRGLEELGNSLLYGRYFLERFVLLEISLQDIFY